MPVCPAPDLAALDDKTLLMLSRSWGRLGKIALRKFVSTLPEVERRGLYRVAKCTSIFEYALKHGGLSADVVRDIRRLHEKIGKFDCLWSLLVEGIVGWSKLLRIADFVTQHNAVWWARTVQEAPKALLDRLAVRLRKLDDHSPEALSNALVRVRNGDTEPPDRGIAESVKSTDTQRATLPVDPPQVQAPGRAQPTESGADSVSEPDPALEGSADAPVPGASETSGPELLTSGASEPVEELDRPRSELVGEIARPDPVVPRKTSLALSPLEEELARRLLAEYQRIGVTLSLGELVGLAIRAMWKLKELPLPAGVALPVQMTRRAHADPERALGDQSAPGSAAEATPEVPEPAKSDSLSDGSRLRKSGSVPLAEHKILAVVISIAETGESYMRTHRGLIRVQLADLSGVAPVIQIVNLAELHAKVSEKAKAWRAEQLPPLGRLYLAAVSGLHCEFDGCRAPGVNVHHLKPRAEGGSHEPGNVFSLCHFHHLAHHGGLVENPSDPPGQWQLVPAGRLPEGAIASSVDRAVQAIRKKATAAGFRVA